MRAILIGSQNEKDWYEMDRLGEEFNKKRIRHERYFYENFKLAFCDGVLRFYHGNEPVDFKTVNFAYVRSATGKKRVFTDIKTILASYLVKQKISVVNGSSLIRWEHFPKILQHYYLETAGIPTVDTLYSSTITEDQSAPLQFPFVAKKSLSSMGKDVVKVDNSTEFQAVVKKYGAEKIIMQPFLRGGTDYRVFVIGGKAIGMIERKATKGGFLTNISAGGKATEVPLTDEVKELAERGAQLFNLDVCGVDIIYDGKIPLILEINRHAQFQGFEKATGINVARKIVEFMVEKAR